MSAEFPNEDPPTERAPWWFHAVAPALLLASGIFGLIYTHETWRAWAGGVACVAAVLWIGSIYRRRAADNETPR